MLAYTSCFHAVYAIAFRENVVDSSFTNNKKAVTTVSIVLNIWMDGNMTQKANTTATIKVNVVK